MATYAELARDKMLAARRQRQDKHIASVSARMDAEVAANTDKRGGWKTMKYERASFAVVTASDDFRNGYDLIDWTKGPQANEPVSTVTSATPTQGD